MITEYLIFFNRQGIFDYCIDYNESYSNHFKIHKRICVFDPIYTEQRRDSKMIRKNQCLILKNISTEVFREIIDLFNSDKVLWIKKFTSFSKDNYPEYFI